MRRILKSLFDSGEIFSDGGPDVLYGLRFNCALRPATRETGVGNAIALFRPVQNDFVSYGALFSSPFSPNVAWGYPMGCGRNVMGVESGVSGVSAGRMISSRHAITLWLVCHPASDVSVQRACSVEVSLVRLR